MVIITLVGAPKDGKSTTIKKLFLELYDRGALVDYNASGRKSQHISTIRAAVGKRQSRTNDIAEVLEYKGKRIGVFSAGDSVQLFSEALCFFENNHCDIGVNAASVKNEQARAWIQLLRATGTFFFPIQYKGNGTQSKTALRTETKGTAEMSVKTRAGKGLITDGAQRRAAIVRNRRTRERFFTDKARGRRGFVRN